MNLFKIHLLILKLKSKYFYFVPFLIIVTIFPLLLIIIFERYFSKVKDYLYYSKYFLHFITIDWGQNIKKIEIINFDLFRKRKISSKVQNEDEKIV